MRPAEPEWAGLGAEGHQTGLSNSRAWYINDDLTTLTLGCLCFNKRMPSDETGSPYKGQFGFTL